MRSITLWGLMLAGASLTACTPPLTPVAPVAPTPQTVTAFFTLAAPSATPTPSWTAPLRVPSHTALSATTAPATTAPATIAPATTAPATAMATACGHTWFFSPAPTTCPGQPPVLADTVFQPFEHGWMLWRAVPGPYGSSIYVFFTDGFWPQWNPTLDTWRPGMPEAGPAIQPPPGLFAPVRGFGLIWRTSTIPQGGAVMMLRDRLGWALAPEASLGILPMQCHHPERYEDGCFLAGSQGAIYRLEEGNRWELLGPAAP